MSKKAQAPKFVSKEKAKNGEIVIDIPKPGHKTLSEAQRSDLKAELAAVLREIRMIGSFNLNFFSQVQGSPNTQGLTVYGQPKQNVINVAYQIGGNNRYAYSMSLPPHLVNDCHKELKAALTSAGTKKSVKEPAVKDQAGPPVVTEDETSSVDVGVPTVASEVATVTKKPTAAPAAGYVKDDDWRNQVLAVLLTKLDADGLVSKDSVLEVLQQHTHHERAFAGYGAVLGQLVFMGWLKQAEATTDDVRYHVVTENPQRVKRGSGSTPKPASTPMPAKSLPVELVSLRVRKFLLDDNAVHAVLSGVKASEFWSRAKFMTSLLSLSTQWTEVDVDRVIEIFEKYSIIKPVARQYGLSVNGFELVQKRKSLSAYVTIDRDMSQKATVSNVLDPTHKIGSVREFMTQTEAVDSYLKALGREQFGHAYAMQVFREAFPDWTGQAIGHVLRMLTERGTLQLVGSSLDKVYQVAAADQARLGFTSVTKPKASETLKPKAKPVVTAGEQRPVGTGMLAQFKAEFEKLHQMLKKRDADIATLQEANAALREALASQAAHIEELEAQLPNEADELLAEMRAVTNPSE